MSGYEFDRRRASERLTEGCGNDMGWFDRPEFGPNVGLIDDVYRQYLDDPMSVSEAWLEFFSEHEPEEPDEGQPEQAPAAAPAAPARTQEPPGPRAREPRPTRPAA